MFVCHPKSIVDKLTTNIILGRQVGIIDITYHITNGPSKHANNNLTFLSLCMTMKIMNTILHLGVHCTYVRFTSQCCQCHIVICQQRTHPTLESVK